MSESKDRLTYRPEPETRQKIEQWYEADNCRSMNEFIDKAVSFYADWLSANRNDMLPRAISSAMDGRLKILEKNLLAVLQPCGGTGHADGYHCGYHADRP